jgi:hypothetical protein
MCLAAHQGAAESAAINGFVHALPFLFATAPPYLKDHNIAPAAYHCRPARR